jgi:hypothetical protein
MDSANKQTAVVAEVTQGTTPATPAFKVLRDIRVTGSPSRPNNRSPERRPDRQAANMVTGLKTFQKTIELPWARDAGTDILWESVFNNAWSANVLKLASTKKSFTLEEKYEGGATDPYRRLAGCLADSVNVGFRNGEAGSLSFGIRGLNETMTTTAIASSTYAAPTPGYDPVTPADIVVTDLFGLTLPRVMSFNMQITNNIRDQHAFGASTPWGLGLGLLNVQGTVQLYLSQASDYGTFMERQTGLNLDITIGSVGGAKDQFVLSNVDVWDPDIDDPGASGDHMVTYNFMARYDATDLTSITMNRNVA